MGRRTIALVEKKDVSRQVLFLNGFHPDVPLGKWTTPDGQPAYVLSVGLVTKSVIGGLFPKALEMKGEELTQICYRLV